MSLFSYNPLLNYPLIPIFFCLRNRDLFMDYFFGEILFFSIFRFVSDGSIYLVVTREAKNFVKNKPHTQHIILLKHNYL